MAASLYGSKVGMPCQPVRSLPLNGEENPLGGSDASACTPAATTKVARKAVNPGSRTGNPEPFRMAGSLNGRELRQVVCKGARGAASGRTRCEGSDAPLTAQCILTDINFPSPPPREAPADVRPGAAFRAWRHGVFP